MSESEENLSFEYEDEIADGSESDFSFEEDLDSEEEEIHNDNDNDFESIQLFNNISSTNFHPIKRNRVSYEPWKLTSYIQEFLLDKAITLKNMQLPQCDFDNILIMLHFKNWQPEDVINAFYDDWPKLRDSCGLTEPSEKDNNVAKAKNFNCSVCCENYEITEVYSLSCDHKFCLNCYYEYARENIHNGRIIRCIDVECNLSIPHADLEMLLQSRNGKHDLKDFTLEMTKNHLLAAAAKVYIESHKLKWKWCPAPDCTNLTELVSRKVPKTEIGNGEDVDILNVPIVTCPESHEFCYDCQYENHLPCPCWIVKLWVKKCQDDSETANWIQANTQGCPKCGSLIEKNGGCNHMTCSKCRYEFCWICLVSWKEHGASYYKCNRFDPEETDAVKKLQQLKRLSLQRYLHFYKRFSVHESSMQGDKKIIDKVDNKMKLYMEEELKKKNKSQQNLSWIDVQFLHDAIRALTNGRKTLKWTYCFAFYLSKTNFSEIFEQMQDYLNKTVEDLSLIFEEVNSKKHKTQSSMIIMKHKQEIVNLSNLVIKRQKLLIECAYSGLNQGHLVFEVA